jgi:hypothetical protein
MVSGVALRKPVAFPAEGRTTVRRRAGQHRRSLTVSAATCGATSDSREILGRFTPVEYVSATGYV